MKSKDVLLPAAATAAAAAAAGLAAQKGPDGMKMLGSEANEEAEEIGRKGAEGAKKELGAGGGIAGKAASKLLGGKSGGSGGGGKTRRLPIQRWTDVAVPVEKAYKAWTQFEEYPKFMHRVLEVEQDDDDKNKIHWREKIWFSTREWDAEITDKRQNDRIAWKSVSGTQHSGVISFHRLDKNLTRILVTVDFVPTGMIEKMGWGLRFATRAVEADLARFKAYVEFGDAKEIEYRSQPEDMEQHRSGDDDESDDAQGREEPKGEEPKAEEGSDEDDRDRESDRRDRENRRQERREALSSS
ncbi:MAG: SRPBCC family protein [Gaiellaceae bacterium]